MIAGAINEMQPIKDFEMSVTIKDIAMLAGVSHQAVSSALNGNGSSRVSAEKKERIQKIAKELNYIPNAIARKLVNGNTKAIGIVSSMHSGWNLHLISEICESVTAHGYNTLLSHFSDANHCALDSLLELVSRGVDGVIILNSDSIEELQRGLNIPYVFGSCNNRAGYDVAISSESIGYLATRHLLEHGHEKVAHIRVMMFKDAKIKGWKRAQAERGIQVSDSDIICLRDIDGQVDALLEFIRRRKVTALFCSNDFVAAKIMRALQENGIRVPDDVAIIGCDGRSFVEFGTTTLTTVLQPLRLEAQKIVELMLERIRTQELRPDLANINIEPRLWLGGSCGCPRHKLSELYRINTPDTLEKDLKLNFNQDIIE